MSLSYEPKLHRVQRCPAWRERCGKDDARHQAHEEGAQATRSEGRRGVQELPPGIRQAAGGVAILDQRRSYAAAANAARVLHGGDEGEVVLPVRMGHRVDPGGGLHGDASQETFMLEVQGGPEINNEFTFLTVRWRPRGMAGLRAPTALLKTFPPQLS